MRNSAPQDALAHPMPDRESPAKSPAARIAGCVSCPLPDAQLQNGDDSAR